MADTEENKLESNDQYILGLDIEELLKLDTSKLTRRQFRIRTLLLIYAKHCLNCEAISWHEISDILFDDLTNTIGDVPYQEWLKRYEIQNL